jgi:homoserine dehydrogenase
VHQATRACVLVDATSPSYWGPLAERWVARLEAALRSGTNVVTCNKAPLAIAWERLQRAAQSGGASIACSATVGAGTPVLATLRRLQQVHGIVRIEASLSGSLAFVLDHVVAGADLDHAVRSAQVAGYTEPDPAIDLDGTDLQAKATILHNAVFGSARSLASGRVPLQLDAGRIRYLAADGQRPTVVARIDAAGIRLDLTAREREGPGSLSSPTTNLDVRAFHPDGSMSRLCGPGAGAQATAASLLADLRAIAEGAVPTGGIWP